MSLSKWLFGERKTLSVRSLDELVETRPLRFSSLPWEQAPPSDLAVGGGIAVAVVEKTVLVSIDASGVVLSTYRQHGKPIRAVAIDSRGEWVASAEDEGSFLYVRKVRDAEAVVRLDTTAPVSALAFGTDAIYAGLRSGVIEVHPWGGKRPGSTQRYELAARIFEEIPPVRWIDVSPAGDRIAVIIGGILFLWNKADTSATVVLEKKIEFMAARFSADGKRLAAVGGHREFEITLQDMTTKFHDVRGALYVRDMERGRSALVQGEGYWIQNVFWSASGDRLLCLPSVAPQEIGQWTKAISFHSTEVVWGGSSRPESVTRIGTSVDTESAAIIAPGRLLMVVTDEGGGIGCWDVGEEFAPPAPVAAAQTGSTARSPATHADPEPSLDAIVIVFNRDFPTSGQFVDEILSRLTTRGRTYRSWMRDDTPVRIKFNPKAQDEMTVAAMALIEFRKLIGGDADPKRVQFGTFEGNQGIVGSVLSHWH
jgi:hypothetical protein